MDNKLVFEPTILTQYTWDKYNLLTNYTYYWQVHQAVAEYMTQYTWSKNEVLPDDVPSWDKYTAVDELAPKHYWLQYNTIEKQRYYYRKRRYNTTNNYTFKWDKSETHYVYTCEGRQALHAFKYPVKKYAAKNSETSQTYYYYDKYLTFREYDSTAKAQRIHLGYNNKTNIYNKMRIVPVSSNGRINLVDMTPEPYSNFKVRLYSARGEYVYSYIESGGTTHPAEYNSSTQISPYGGMFRYSTQTGLPDINDANYHQFYPYGCPDINSNTSGFKSIVNGMRLYSESSNSRRMITLQYFLRDTDGNYYMLSPYSYYDWDDGLVHNVYKLNVYENLEEKTNGYSTVNVCPTLNFSSLTPNFYSGFNSTTTDYVGYNRSGVIYPAFTIAENSNPDGYKFITTSPLQNTLSSDLIAHLYSETYLNSGVFTWGFVSGNTWRHFWDLEHLLMDYCYKQETITKEKDGNDYEEDYIILQFKKNYRYDGEYLYRDSADSYKDGVYNCYYNYSLYNDALTSYYDSENDKWIEIDYDNWEDIAILAGGNLNLGARPTKNGRVVDVELSDEYKDYIYWRGTVNHSYFNSGCLLIMSIKSEGWVDSNTEEVVVNVSQSNLVFPQPKPTDYHPEDDRVNGYHWVLKSQENNPTYSATNTIYGTEEQSNTQRDTNTIQIENGDAFKWYLNRTETYQAAGSTYLGEVSDWNANAFPNPDGIKGDYFYRYAGSQPEPNGNFTKGTFIEEVLSSRSDTYPQDGYQDGYWYVYYGTVNTEHRYKYEKAVIYDVYKTYWYAYVPKNKTVEQVEYRTSRGSYPTTFYWYDTDMFYNPNGFWDDELIHLSHPINIFTGWLQEYRHLGNLQSTSYDRYIRIPNWYCNLAIPRSVHINTITESDRELNSGANLYDMRQFADNIMAKYNAFIYELAPDVPDTSDVYNNTMIAAAVGVQRPYINKYQTIPLPGGGTISGEYPYYNVGTSKPWYRGLIATGNTYTRYNGDVKYTYRGENDENYLNAGYTYRGMEDNPNPDYVYQYIEDVVSFVPNAFPDGEIAADGYYYEITNQENVIMGYHKGAFIENVSSSNPEAYKNNFVDFENRYYTYSHADANYSKGNYVESVKSYIETAYPQNGYVINDAWYVYTSSQEVIVGQIEINKSQLMGGVNYTQEINPSEDLMIGTPGAAQIDFTIFAPDASAATQYLGKDFTYYVKMNSDNDWRQIGTFTLTKAELPDKQTAKIQGFDYIYKFDTIIDEWLDEQTFPMTLGNMFASLCEYVGCEAYSTDFTNSDFMVNDNFEAVQITGRTILQYITEASGGFCVAEPDGRIHLKHYAIPPTGAVNLGNNSYRKYTHEIYNVPVISSVVVRKDDDDEGVESNV